MRSTAGILIGLASVAAQAGEPAYPVRPVRVLVSATPGGTIDLVARVLAPRLSEQTGQAFVVDNRAGAGGVIAAELIARAAPDGYTLGAVYTSFTTNAVLHRKPSYDPVNDFSPLMLVSASPLALVAYPGTGVDTVRDLLALARTKPLHYASSGNGSGGHMCGELLKLLAKVPAMHVPYKGAAAATADVVAGQVQFQFAGPVTVVSLARSGRLRLLAVTSLKRNAALPDVPTLDEAGVPGFDVVNWFGMVAPARLPVTLVNDLHRRMTAALQHPEARARLGGEGAEVIAGTPESFAEFLRRDVAKWRKVVTASGMSLD